MGAWTEQKLAELTQAEKATLLAGRNLWETVAIDRVGVPAIKVTDGPNGARGGDGNHGPTSTSFPVGVAMGASFNPVLIEAVGRSLAKQVKSKGASVLLGPTVNIPRVPITGRNFECFSEDPLLSGTIAAAYIKGVQSQGIAACIKHFVCNDQETDRHSISSEVDQRTLYEIYLEPFRIAIADSSPWAVMSSYNRINGVTSSENPLLEEVLRAQLGFDGVVISDWFGTYSPQIVSSGLDLEMPGPARFHSTQNVKTALAEGAIESRQLDRKVEHLLTLMERVGLSDTEGETDRTEKAEELASDRDLIRQVGTESMVLLKNDGLLPLAGSEKVAVIGEFAANTPNQGGGSSTVNPHRVVSILAGMKSAWSEPDHVHWNLGTHAYRNFPRLEGVTQPDGTPGFLIEYFDNTQLSGEPVRVVNSSKSFLVFFGIGDNWIEYENFGVRFSGDYVATVNGRHNFSVGALGNFRVWAGEKLAVDRWDTDQKQSETSTSTDSDVTDPREGVDIEEMLTGSDAPPTWEVELEVGERYRLVLEYGCQPGEPFRYVGMGCRLPSPEDPIAVATASAAEAETAVVVVGLNQEWESEGFDRDHLRLPGQQEKLITEVAKVQPKTVVVLTGGSPIEMPWLDQVSAVLHAWYGGQEVGHAVTDILLGKADPAGRMPVTFPTHLHQHPGMLNFPGEGGEVRYGEGVYVGYRGFDYMGLEPLFPFGFGMSYTRFAATPPGASTTKDVVTVRTEISNVGERDGKEVVMVFAHDLGQVPRRLVGYTKMGLSPEETQSIEINIPRDRLRCWNPSASTWEETRGELKLSVTGLFPTQHLTVEL